MTPKISTNTPVMAIKILSPWGKAHVDCFAEWIVERRAAKESRTSSTLGAPPAVCVLRMEFCLRVCTLTVPLPVGALQIGEVAQK